MLPGELREPIQNDSGAGFRDVSVFSVVDLPREEPLNATGKSVRGSKALGVLKNRGLGLNSGVFVGGFEVIPFAHTALGPVEPVDSTSENKATHHGVSLH